MENNERTIHSMRDTLQLLYVSVYVTSENSWCGALLGKRKCAIHEQTKYPEKLEN